MNNILPCKGFLKRFVINGAGFRKCMDCHRLHYVCRDEYIATTESYARIVWSLRVLDAFTDLDRQAHAPVAMPNPADGSWLIFVRGQEFTGDDADAVRLAAAKSIYPTLKPELRAKLEECP